MRTPEWLYSPQSGCWGSGGTGVLMVEVCCWERKFDWGEGGGSGAGDLGNLGRLGFLRGQLGAVWPGEKHMGIGLVEVEVVSLVSDLRKECMVSSLRLPHLLDISYDSFLRTIMSNCITKENGNLFAH